MNIPAVLAFSIFGTFAVIFVAGNIYEWRGMKNFNLKVYRKGPRIFRSKEDWIIMHNPSEEIFKTTSGSFKIIDKNQLLFKFDQAFFSLQFKTPFPLKGSLVLEENTATISARAPMIPCIFIIFWLFIWTCISITIIFSYKTEMYIGLLNLIFGWVGCGLMIYFSYTIERKRLLQVLSEIKDYRF